MSEQKKKVSLDVFNAALGAAIKLTDMEFGFAGLNDVTIKENTCDIK